jgi:hypothetical protein
MVTCGGFSPLSQSTNERLGVSAVEEVSKALHDLRIDNFRGRDA